MVELGWIRLRAEQSSSDRAPPCRGEARGHAFPSPSDDEVGGLKARSARSERLASGAIKLGSRAAVPRRSEGTCFSVTERRRSRRPQSAIRAERASSERSNQARIARRRAEEKRGDMLFRHRATTK